MTIIIEESLSHPIELNSNINRYLKTKPYLVRYVFERINRNNPKRVVPFLLDNILSVLQKADPSLPSNWEYILLRYNVEELMSLIYEGSEYEKEGILNTFSEFIQYWFRLLSFKYLIGMPLGIPSKEELNEIGEGIILFCLIHKVMVLNDCNDY